MLTVMSCVSLFIFIYPSVINFLTSVTALFLYTLLVVSVAFEKATSLSAIDCPDLDPSVLPGEQEQGEELNRQQLCNQQHSSRRSS